MNILGLWVLLRIVTTAFAAIVSSLRPDSLLELKIPIFPPSAPLSQWLERTFVSPWMRWDALWYEKIVSHGYSATDGTAQFHPLYPWLATLISKIGFSPTLSLMILSSIAGIALFYWYIKLAQLDLNPKDAFFSLMIFSLAPPAFVLFAPYSEALFLLLSVLCLYFIRQKKWWLAGVMGCLATLTRQQGIFLVFPMVWELWVNAGGDFKAIVKQWKRWSAISLIPLGFLLWMIYRVIIIHDFILNFTDIQAFIYSTLISPSANQVVTAQKFVWPWQALYYSINKIITQPDLDIWVNIILGFLYLVILAISWKKTRISYRIYSCAIALVSFSYYTGPVHPYMGLPRHLLLGFPVFIGMASVLNKVWLRLVILTFSAAGLIFLLGLYVLNAWVP